MDEHTGTAAPEATRDGDVDDRRHGVGQAVDRQCRVVGGHGSVTDPEDRGHHVLEWAARIVEQAVHAPVDTLQVARADVMGQVAAVDPQLFGLARAEVAELGVGEGVQTVEHPLGWHECHSNYDIGATPAPGPTRSHLIVPASSPEVSSPPSLLDPRPGAFLGSRLRSVGRDVEAVSGVGKAG